MEIITFFLKGYVKFCIIFLLDPDILLAREEALQRSRQRLQEQHDELARQHAEKMKLVIGGIIYFLLS